MIRLGCKVMNTHEILKVVFFIFLEILNTRNTFVLTRRILLQENYLFNYSTLDLD